MRVPNDRSSPSTPWPEGMGGALLQDQRTQGEGPLHPAWWVWPLGGGARSPKRGLLWIHPAVALWLPPSHSPGLHSPSRKSGLVNARSWPGLDPVGSWTSPQGKLRLRLSGSGGRPSSHQQARAHGRCPINSTSGNSSLPGQPAGQGGEMGPESRWVTLPPNPGRGGPPALQDLHIGTPGRAIHALRQV